MALAEEISEAIRLSMPEPAFRTDNTQLKLLLAKRGESMRGTANPDHFLFHMKHSPQEP